MPHPEKLKQSRSLQILGDWIHEPNLWHINRYSTSTAFFIGLFCAFIPLPGQMLIAALVALRLHSNLPLSIALVWTSNPVTMPPIFYGCYLLGSHILGTPEMAFEFELSWRWLGTGFLNIWQPFLLGCLLCGLFFGCLGFLVVNQVWRLFVFQRWQDRKKRRS